MTEIKEKISEILFDNLKYLKEHGDFDWNKDLKFYGLDSMSLVSILLALEVEFDISIPEEFLSAETLKTADSLYQIVSLMKANN